MTRDLFLHLFKLLLPDVCARQRDSCSISVTVTVNSKPLAVDIRTSRTGGAGDSKQSKHRRGTHARDTKILEKVNIGQRLLQVTRRPQ